MSINLPEVEVEVLKRWKEIGAFERSVELARGRERYTFWDGPPFATGLPHFGHLLASTIKDIIPRYWTMKGYLVERRFGWDTHGLPIEYEIDKQYGQSGQDAVNLLGLEAYNKACRGIVMRYAEQWRQTIDRLGRWIDFDNDYKTMDTDFMESVWAVFKRLYDAGEVYRSYQVMPYSTGLRTPLSQHEAQQNRRTTKDNAITVSFPLLSEEHPDTHLLIWTTTPWTLPSNLLICINKDFEYVKVFDDKTKRHYILLESAMHMLYKKPKDVKIISRIKGEDMVGWKYEPPFDYFKKDFSDCFFVLAADHVVADEGVGLVHTAPAFGSEDYTAAVAAGLIGPDRFPPNPVDDKGSFTAEVTDYAGQYVKDAERPIIKYLKSINRLITDTQYSHDIAFCWRSETPLLQKAVSAWFIKVANDVPSLLKGIEESTWVPPMVKDHRFARWIANARDWNVSRNRYWGNPLPIWASEDYEEIICVGSIAELKELSGVEGEIKDLHRDTVDNITIPSRKGKGNLKRVSEVFDCWFESGSMPYASQHYPFEHADEFLKSMYPAAFIAEGLDQTRGWFYTLAVLGVKLFKTFPFRNCIVNGIVLAEDGKKMSKKEKNYPDPSLVISKYGADTLRLYLISSPVVRAEPMRFKEVGLREINGTVFRPFWNSYKFFEEQVALLKKAQGISFVFNPKVGDGKSMNVMDRWILAECQSLLVFTNKEMAGYRLYTVVPRLLKLIENLTNWYIRLNRARLKGTASAEVDDTIQALNTLFEVLYTLVRALAPFIPFLTDHTYQLLLPYIPQELKDEIPDSRSVHFLKYPEVRKELFDEEIERKVARMQKVIDLTRLARERRSFGLKQPLQTLVVVADAPYLDDVVSLQAYVKKELNVREVIFESDGTKYNVKLAAEVDWPTLGKRLKGGVQAVRKALPNLTDEQINSYIQEKKLVIEGHELKEGDLSIVRVVKKEESSSNWEVSSDNEALVLLDTTLHEHLQTEFLARDIVNRVQRLRKKAGLVPTDDVRMEYTVLENPDAVDFENAIKEEDQMLKTALRGPLEEKPLPVKKEGAVAEANGQFLKEGKDDLIAEEETTISKATCIFRLLKL